MLPTQITIASTHQMEGSSVETEECIKVGPWGGPGGRGWSFKPRAGSGGITEIIIRHGWAIDSIQFQSQDQHGNTDNSIRFGGKGGDRTDKIVLDWPREYLCSISGSYGPFMKYVVLKSLKFQTNRITYGPYGRKSDNAFSFPMKGGAIIGFHGKAGGLIDRIGVYAVPIGPVCASIRVLGSKLDDIKVKKEKDAMSLILPRGAGPWGGSGGRSWDDGVFAAVKEVRVYFGNGIVHALQFRYLCRDGKSVWSEKHGGPGGDTVERVKLEEKNEELMGISGFYAPVDGSGGYQVLRSLRFNTNKGNYGPFGSEVGSAFASTPAAGRVVGFHGSSGHYVDSIGLHMEYLS